MWQLETREKPWAFAPERADLGHPRFAGNFWNKRWFKSLPPTADILKEVAGVEIPKYFGQLPGIDSSAESSTAAGVEAKRAKPAVGE